MGRVDRRTRAGGCLTRAVFEEGKRGVGRVKNSICPAVEDDLGSTLGRGGGEGRGGRGKGKWGGGAERSSEGWSEVTVRFVRR